MMKEAREAGREEGEKIGREAREMAIKTTIEICHDVGLQMAETATKLVVKFNLTEDEAEAKVNQYWNV